MTRDTGDDAGASAGSPVTAVRGDVVQHDMHRELRGHAAVDEGEEAANSRARGGHVRTITTPGGRRRQAPRRHWWCRDADVVVAAPRWRRGRLGIIGSHQATPPCGAVECLDLTRCFSSTHKPDRLPSCVRWVETQSPATSRTLSMNCGSERPLERGSSTTVRLRPNLYARLDDLGIVIVCDMTTATARSGRPLPRAVVLRSVLTITLQSGRRIVRGAPGRELIAQSIEPPLRKRLRHSHAVTGWQSSAAAIRYSGSTFCHSEHDPAAPAMNLA